MGYQNIHSSTIYYELLKGDPQKPYLIFLHEGLGCVILWKSLFAHLVCTVSPFQWGYV
jgi:hypothetical protein